MLLYMEKRPKEADAFILHVPLGPRVILDRFPASLDKFQQQVGWWNWLEGFQLSQLCVRFHINTSGTLVTGVQLNSDHRASHVWIFAQSLKVVKVALVFRGGSDFTAAADWCEPW